MARLSRIVIPNQPGHIMHRGNNRQNIFESEEDMVRIKEDQTRHVTSRNTGAPVTFIHSPTQRMGDTLTSPLRPHRVVIASSNGWRTIRNAVLASLTR